MSSITIPPLARLAAMHARINELCDRSAVRTAVAVGNAADALEEATLMTGAMRGEFRVMVRFQRNQGGMSLMPVLV